MAAETGKKHFTRSNPSPNLENRTPELLSRVIVAMSYTSENILPAGTSLKCVIDIIDLLGYQKAKSFKVPEILRSYYWQDDIDYRSWTGVELDVCLDDGAIKVLTRTRISRSYWDLQHQNKTIRQLRGLLGGDFVTDEGRNRYPQPINPPPSPISSGCYLARWRLHNALMKVGLYLSVRHLNADHARNGPTGFDFLDEMNPRLLSNNLLVPYLIGVWEEFFRALFVAALKSAEKRETVLKKARLSYHQLEQIATAKQPVEQIISECFSFQRPSLIAENFRMLDSKIDLAGAFRKPFRGRKISLFDSLEILIEKRNRFVHSGEMDLTLYDEQIQRIHRDIVEAADRAYALMGKHFNFVPIKNY